MINTDHQDSGRAARAAPRLALLLLAVVIMPGATAQTPAPAADTMDASKTMHLILQRFAARRARITTLQFDAQGTYRNNPSAFPKPFRTPNTWSALMPFAQMWKTFRKSMHVTLRGEDIRDDVTTDIWNAGTETIDKDRHYTDVQQGTQFREWLVDEKIPANVSFGETVFREAGLDEALAFLRPGLSTLGQYDFTVKNLDDHRRGRTPFVTITNQRSDVPRRMRGMVSPQQMNNTWTQIEYDLDPERDYLPVSRRDRLPNGNLAHEMQIEYKADARAGYLPSHIKITNYLDGRIFQITEMDCSAFKINEPLDPKTFQLDLLPGTELNDARQRR